MVLPITIRHQLISHLTVASAHVHLNQTYLRPFDDSEADIEVGLLFSDVTECVT